SQLGSVPTLAGLAYSLRGIDLDHIVFETMPFEWAGDRVRPAPEAEQLWAALDADEPIDGARDATGEDASANPTDDGTAEPSAEPTTEAPPITAEPEPTPTSICP